MKKTFSFKVKNKIPARQIESIKGEIKKYIARERRKPTPKGVDFWEFDCRFGLTEESAAVVKLVDVRNYISKAFDEGEESFYLEILSKPGHKPKKLKVERVFNKNTDESSD